MPSHAPLMLLMSCAVSASAWGLEADSDPLNTLARIQYNYTNTLDYCQEPETGAPRGHYYCSGITLRMVNDGPFNPWDYSPYAVGIGATSFSWIRSDLSTNQLAHPAGFILRTPMDAHRAQRPAKETGYKCIFSFDGFTGPERKENGCGAFDVVVPSRSAQPSMSNKNSALAYGGCAEVGITTAAQWLAQFPGSANMPIQKSQCSWNAEVPSDWDAMIQVHEGRPQDGDGIAVKDMFNEFMVRNASDSNDGSANMEHIDAFIYNVNSTYNFSTRGDTTPAVAENGLNSAQQFQRKLYAQGYAVPVLRLDFSQPADQRFSYAAEDQAVPLNAEGNAASPYIAATRWQLRQDPGTRRQEWTLTVVPTAEGKAQLTLDEQAVYQALYRLRGADPQWQEGEKATGSMQQQLACIASLYPNRSDWNLEPFRPHLSAQDTAAAYCNPVAEQYVASSRWIERYDPGSRQNEWTLEVNLTSAGQRVSGTSDALYRQLRGLRGKDRNWVTQERSPGSMQAQIRCLKVNFPNKSVLNLEPFRPTVSDQQARAAGCNPF